MPKKLVIVGAGAVGRQIVQIARDISQINNEWTIAGIVDDNEEAWGSTVAGVPVLGGLEWIVSHPRIWVVVAVGSGRDRESIVRRIEAHCEVRYATLIHHLAWIGERTRVGPGTVVYPGALIDPDVDIGCHVQLNKGCSIGHDCRITDFATIAPNTSLGGGTQIGEGADMGIASCTIPGVTVGAWARVGAGAVVIRSIPAGVTAVGVPARPLNIEV